MKQLKIIFLFVSTLLLFGPARVSGQQAQAQASLDTNAMLVGDQVGYNLKLTLPENFAFRWPVFADTLTKGLEVVKQGPVDTARQNGLMRISQKLMVTAFDSGYYVLPPVTFKYGPSAAALNDSVQTDPYLLNVYTLDVDTTKAIRPIKGPVSVPYSLAELWPWIVLALVIIAIVLLVVYFNRQRKNRKPFVFVKPKPKLPPHAVALQALAGLKKEKLWQQGKIKEYHTRLTDILREYIEGRFHVRAVEMTTWDIMQSVQQLDLDETDKNMLRNILEMADLVKFAKAKPLADDHDRSMHEAQEFVRNTKATDTEKNGQPDKPQPGNVEQANSPKQERKNSDAEEH